MGRLHGAGRAASLVNPTGWVSLLYTLQVIQMSVALDGIGEWKSPDFHQAQPLELWMMLVLALACSARLRLPWLRLLLVLALTHLALKHQRNVALLGLIAPLLVATPLGRQWRAHAGAGHDVASLDRMFLALAAPARAPAIAGTALLLALLMGMAAYTHRFVPATGNTPEAALQAAQRAGVLGPVLNSYNFGGYLIFRSVPVFIDGRADMYGDALLQRYQNAMSLATPQALSQLLSDYHITWTLLEPGTPALLLLERLPGWTKVYEDGVAVVHVLKP